MLVKWDHSLPWDFVETKPIFFKNLPSVSLIPSNVMSFQCDALLLSVSTEAFASSLFHSFIIFFMSLSRIWYHPGATW